MAASDIDQLVRDAWQAFSCGDMAATERFCTGLLAAEPQHVAALSLLAAAVNAQGRHAEASMLFSKLTVLQPGERTHWMNLGTALRANGRPDEALSAYLRAAALGERSADFFYNVGLLHLERGDYESSRNLLARARALTPGDAEICYQFAHTCHECARNADALAALDGWEQWVGLTAELAAKISLLMLALGEPLRSEAAVARVLEDPHPGARARLKLLQIYERTNRMEAAQCQLAELRRSGDIGDMVDELSASEAHLAQREGRHEHAAALLQAALTDVKQFRLRHVHLFPLAKSLDAMHRYDDAFSALADAHQSQLAQIGASAADAAVRRAPTLMITRFGCDAADVSAWRDEAVPGPHESPVFVVAFPRSGTTLLEQCLDAHPLLQSMDEQPYLQNAIDAITDAGVSYPERLANLSSLQLEAVRDRYWRLTRQKVQLAPGQRLIDKNPLNLLRLPAIRRLFPHAPILLAIRHPCDVILSCYMQHFTAPEFALICRDLPSLAGGFRQAFDFWYAQAELLRPQVLEVRYEAFVADFERQVRRVSEFLQLPWNEAMLAPGEHAHRKGFIATPSYSQVVQPVNRRSVDRWRHYERHFGEAVRILEPYLQRWGYKGLRIRTAGTSTE